MKKKIFDSNDLFGPNTLQNINFGYLYNSILPEYVRKKACLMLSWNKEEDCAEMG